MLKRLAGIAAACLLACAPALAQDVRTLPQASALTGAEKMPAVQGAGCPSKTTPCAAVAVTPSLISTFLTPTFQAKDADLDAIAALATVDFGRQLLTKPDATSIRSAIGLESMATQAAGGVAITGGSITGITDLAIADGGTGAGTAAAARANLGAAASGANADITSITGLTTALAIGQGGTGRTTAVPALSVSRAGTNGASFQTVANSFTTILLNTVAIDTAGAFNSTTGVYTLPETGLYLITAKLRLVDSAPAAVSYGIGVDATNADNPAFFWATTAAGATTNRHGIMNIRLFSGTAGAQLRLYAYVDNASGYGVTTAELNIIRLR